MESNAQLVQLCLRGDGSAWETLVKAHTRRVYNLCYRFTGNRAAAEDLSQEVFLRVYRTLESYRAEQGAFPTWLTSVTRNLLVDHYRRSRRDRLTDSMDDEFSSAETQEAAGRSPYHAALATELKEQLQQALSQLSPELREAVILRDLQEMEYREIQSVLQIPEGTVKSRINRGRIDLARILESMGARPS